MAGPKVLSNINSMLWITIPSALVYAFFARRTGLIKVVLGAGFFSLPLVLLCHLSSVDSNSADSAAQIRALHRIANFTAGFAISASLLFALLARINEERNAQHAKA